MVSPSKVVQCYLPSLDILLLESLRHPVVSNFFLSLLFGTLNKSSSFHCTSQSLSPIHQSLLCPALLFPLKCVRIILEMLTIEPDGRSFTEVVHRNEITSSPLLPRHPRIGKVFIASALS